MEPFSNLTLNKKLTLLFCLILFLGNVASSFSQVRKYPVKDTLDYWNVQKFVLTPKTSKEDLNEIKKRLEKENVDITFSDVVYNENGYLSGITINYKTVNSNGTYKVNEDEKFKPVAIEYDVTGKKLTIGPDPVTKLSQTIPLEPRRKSTIKSNDNIKHEQVHRSQTIDTLRTSESNPEEDNVVIVDTRAELVIRKVDGERAVEGDTLSLNSVKRQQWISDDGTQTTIYATQTGNALGQKIILNNQGPKPLFVINGEISKKDINTINPNNIESINVLKGESATEKYGEEAKDLVIEIITKTQGAANSPAPEGTVKYISSTITKNSKVKDFEQQASYLKKVGVEVSFTNVERNELGEITKIKISLKDTDGEISSANFQNSRGIPQLYFGKNRNGLFIDSAR